MFTKPRKAEKNVSAVPIVAVAPALERAAADKRNNQGVVKKRIFIHVKQNKNISAGVNPRPTVSLVRYW